MILPEWHPQRGILMAWPDSKTDWLENLEEAQKCYQDIINILLNYTDVCLICREKQVVELTFTEKKGQVVFIEASYDDTWARDFGPIAVRDEEDRIRFLDFGFNGWGKKFDAENDNLINLALLKNELLPNLTDHRQFILEGGSIETDGHGTLLSTTHCLLAPNRNQPMDLKAIEDYLSKSLGIKRFLWLTSGYLAGDDTDSHIDTLARFCSPKTIAYVQCQDSSDEHYEALHAMEAQLKRFTDTSGEPYNLVPLPMASATYDATRQRLPATYANFLILNEAVLVPTYDSPVDEQAITQLEKAFPDKSVVGVNCNALIKQHGSLHCITMQIPQSNA